MTRITFLICTAFVGLFNVAQIAHADVSDSESIDAIAPFVYMAPVVPAGSLIAHISFDETSGTAAHDSSGNGNDALVSEDTVWAPGMDSLGINSGENAGAISSAISFDGTNDRALILNDVIGTRSVTVCASYNANSLQAGAILISNSQFAISINQNGGLSVTNDGTNYVSSSAQITLGTWNTVCVARDASGHVSIKINGAFDAQGNAGTPVSGSSVGIGGHPWYDNHGWDGLISDVRVYSGIVDTQ